MKAIHLICRRDDSGNLLHVTVVDRVKHVYQSGFWDISIDEAKILMGGWIYLHSMKSSLSEFGGRIVAFQEVAYERAVHARRILFEIEASKSGRGQRWRGKNHSMAWSGGIVAVTFPHES